MKTTKNPYVLQYKRKPKSIVVLEVLWLMAEVIGFTLAACMTLGAIWMFLAIFTGTTGVH